MQIINRNSANTLTFSLAETQTLTSPTFLLQFINDATLVSFTCIAADVSAFPARFNQFIVTETTSPDNLNGEVELELAGFYTYKIYEQTSTTNLDPALSDNTTPLEAGKIRVIEEGNRQATTYLQYQNPEPTQVSWDVFKEEGIVLVPPSTDGTYRNSDSSFVQVIPGGSIFVAPDINWTDSDGSPNTAPANTDIVCTPGSTLSGILYQRPILPGYRTSFSNYDEGWQRTNGTYDYTKTSPATIARLDNDNAAPFHFLDANNAFGNTARFTDENGDYYTDPWDSGSATDAGAFSTGYVIDHLTGLGWSDEPETSTAWATALSNADSRVGNGFSDWRMANINELFSILCFDVNDISGGGSARTGLEYYPFNEGQAAEYFSSTTNRITTTDAYTYHSAININISINLNREPKINSKGYWVCRNHYT